MLTSIVCCLHSVTATPVAQATIPGAPRNLAWQAGNGQIFLGWQAPTSNGGAAITNYRVFRSTNGSTSALVTSGTCANLGAVLACTDTGLNNGQAYTYFVSAVNSAGQGAGSTPVTATPAGPIVPGAPRNLAWQAGNGQIFLGWQAPTSNGGAAITSYRVFRGTTSSNQQVVTSGGCANLGAVLACTDTGLTNGQTYFYIVSAVNSVGQGPPSNQVTATPTGPTIPGAPRNLAWQAGNGQIFLGWQAPTSNGGVTITSYRVFRGTTSSNQQVVTSGGCANLGAVLACTDTGLTNGQTYFYIVSAVNSVGQGPPSNQVTATPAGATSALSITTTSLNPATATVGIGYAAQQAVSATGGQTPYIWSASGLPNGMGINSSTGAVFGTPTVAGTFNFTVTVRDSSSPQKTAPKGLVIPVATATTSMQASPGSGPAGTSFGFAGTGYTPNGTATLAITKPNGQAAGNPKYSVNSSGKVTFNITSQQSDPVGQWTFRLTDDISGKQASTIVQYVSAPPSGTDLMYYTASTVDVTIADNSQFAQGETRNKRWHIQNSGTNTWTNYHLVYVPGTVNDNLSSQLSSVSSLPINASPGQWIDTPPLPITAPQNQGTYYSYWQMENGSGANFGPKIYVKIRVVPKQTGALGFGTQSGQTGTNDSPHSNAAYSDDPVNTATGNYNYESTDLRVRGRGLDFEFARSYNSQDTTLGPLGTGWSHSFNIYLVNVGTSTLSVHYSDGKVLDYANQTGTSNFLSSYPGYYDTLVKNGDNTWTLKKTDQRNYQFDTNGRLISIQDRNANQLSLNYSGGNLSSVTDTVGRTFNFNYSGNLLTSVNDSAGARTIQFAYDVSSNLQSFIDARNNTNAYSYDSNNRLTKIVDGRLNNLVVNTYDSSDRVSTQTNGRGFGWTFTYNPDGSTSVVDPLQKETKYLHDTNFNMERTVDRNTNSLNVLYDEKNNRAQVSDMKGTYASFLYDANGNIQNSTDAKLNSRQASYDQKNNPTQITDELSNQTRFAYDANGNLASVTDALNNPSSTTYNSSGQPLTATDANGNVTAFTYDSQGNLATVKDANNEITSFGYDAVGRRTSMTDARGNITRYTYDANDNLLTVTDPRNNVAAYIYDANNNRISVRDARNNTTTLTYDENNLLIKETDAKGNYNQHTYDKLDLRSETRDKRGNITKFGYDYEGRLISVTDPLTNVTRFDYDENGNRTKIVDAKLQETKFTYDEMNRLKQVEDSLHHTIKKEYDEAGRLKVAINSRNNATQFTYDAVGNLIQVIDAATGTAKYEYDKNRNRTSQTDPNTNKSLLVYDKLGRLKSTSDPLSNTYLYDYDEVGNRISQTDAKSQITLYSYFEDNRLKTITYPNGSTVQLTYDANGNIKQMIDSLGTSTYVYDELNRPTSATDPFGKNIGYQYDENGNIIKLTYPDGQQVTYQYDASNRLIFLTDWANKTTAYEYDSMSLLKKVTYPNGITTNFTYDNAGRLIGKSDSGISSYSFVLDENGNRKSASISQPLGNKLQNTTQSYSYDIANRIKDAGSTTFSFDANGNMTNKTEAGVTTNYGYDFENRLVSVSGSSQYFYNGQGVRLQKIEETKTTRYVVDINHDLSQVLCETDSNSAITAYYIYGIGLAYKVMPDGTHYYYHSDPIGSTIAMTDDAKNVVNSYAYDPFGKVTNSAEGTPNSFRFVGQYGLMDDGNGLTYVRARYYSHVIGRFLTRDSVVGNDNNPQSWNRYTYAFNNPITLIDPDGEFPQLLAGVLIGAGVGLTQTLISDVYRAVETGDFQFSTRNKYLASAAGGAAQGLCVAATAGTGLLVGGVCGAAGAAAENIVLQVTDHDRPFDFQSLLVSSGAGFATGLVAARVGQTISRPSGPRATSAITKYFTGQNTDYYRRVLIRESTTELAIDILFDPKKAQAATNPVGKPQKKH